MKMQVQVPPRPFLSQPRNSVRFPSENFSGQGILIYYEPGDSAAT